MFSSYAHLAGMLSSGWEVESPVYVRPRMHSRLQEEPDTYHFVLWNGDRVALVSVLGCPEIRQFLAEHNLSTDRLKSR